MSSRPQIGPTSSTSGSLGEERPIVLIVDDDVAIRESLSDLFSSAGMEAACFDSTQALLEGEVLQRPGCLILDVRLPGVSGLDLQRRLAAAEISKPVIFLTGHGDIEMTVQAMKAGAVDFLTKPVRDQTLLDAVAVGIERDVAQRSAAEARQRHIDNHAALTPRERQVLRGVALGRLNKQIAWELGISVVTVKLHRSSVMRKMQARTINDLVRAWEALPSRLREPADSRDGSAPAHD